MDKIMVEINLSYFTDLPCHLTTIILNGEELCHDSAVQKMDFTVKTQDEAITIRLFARLPNIPPAITKNPVKIAIAVIVMTIALGTSPDSYDFDCWDYETVFSFFPTQNHINIALNTKSNNIVSHGKADIFADVRNCTVTNITKKATVNEKHTTEQFAEYQHFNFLRTIIFSILCFALMIIGFVTHNIIILGFAVAFFIGNIALFFVSKRLILKMKTKYLCNQEN